MYPGRNVTLYASTQVANMKKALVSLCCFTVLTLISIYIFIPAQLDISTGRAMKANTNVLFRYLSDEAKWDEWWPGESKEVRLSPNNPPKFNNYTYRVTKKLYNVVEVETIKKAQIIAGKIIIIPLAEDSLIVQWRNTFATSINPFVRVQQYLQAVDIKKNMAVLLDSLKSFSEDKEKVYEFNMGFTALRDTFLVATKTVTTNYPSTDVIYELVENLRTYIATRKAKEVDFPMLNITKKDSIHYEIMVAIPTNKKLNGTRNIFFKRIVDYRDQILITEVKGGPEIIKKAYDELNTYMKDYNLTSPVIPWESLITDRSKETDSTKWITKIYIPIA